MTYFAIKHPKQKAIAIPDGPKFLFDNQSSIVTLSHMVKINEAQVLLA